MCDMVTLDGKDNVLGPQTVFLLHCPVHLTFDLLTPILIGNIFLPWLVYMCGMVILGKELYILEPGNHISTSISSALGH
jgi:hypothetical protein